MFSDFFGAFLSIISTYFFIREDSRAWTFGLAAAVFNAWLYNFKHLYADTGIEIFYCFSMFYGYYAWKNRSQKKLVSIKILSSQQKIFAIFAGIIIYYILFQLVSHITNQNYKQLDALTCAFSIIAQFLMCKKFIETWIIWFLTDALYVILYWQSTLFFHSFLFLIYTFLAVIGYYTWFVKSRHKYI